MRCAVLIFPLSFLSSASPLVHAFSGWWQLSQLIEPLFEIRLSKKSCQPSCTFSGVVGFSAGSVTSPRNAGVGGIGGGSGSRTWEMSAPGDATASKAPFAAFTASRPAATT